MYETLQVYDAPHSYPKYRYVPIVMDVVSRPRLNFERVPFVLQPLSTRSDLPTTQPILYNHGGCRSRYLVEKVRYKTWSLT